MNNYINTNIMNNKNNSNLTNNTLVNNNTQLSLKFKSIHSLPQSINITNNKINKAITTN